MGVEQLGESAGQKAEVVVALGGDDEQGLGRRRCVVEAVGGAVPAGKAVVAPKLFDVGGVFDLLNAAEGAAMGGKHGTASRMRTMFGVGPTLIATSIRQRSPDTTRRRISASSTPRLAPRNPCLDLGVTIARLRMSRATYVSLIQIHVDIVGILQI